MKYIIALLLLTVLGLRAHATTTIMAAGCINVKDTSGTVIPGTIAWTGTEAKGDGTTDDTAAINSAINYNFSAGNNPYPIYFPPGTYLCSGVIILWSPGFYIGEPSNPPTLKLKSGSMTSTSDHGDPPFVVPIASQGHSANDQDWWDIGNTGYASANTTVDFDMIDINVYVDSNNAHCAEGILWEMAQRTSLRGCNITRNDSNGSCLCTDGYAGGTEVTNMTTSGGAYAVNMKDTYEFTFRGCTFNGDVTGSNNQTVNFIACTFTNNGHNGFDCQSQVVGMDDCTFASTTTFNPSDDYHIERTTLSNGYVRQKTSSGNTVYYSETSESRTSSKVDGTIDGTPLPNPVDPVPDSGCVNVKASPYNAYGDGNHNDYSAITSALSAANEVYFPPGTYYIGSSTLTLSAGQKIFGAGSDYFTHITGTANPIVNTTGNGSGSGVTIAYISIMTTSTVTGHDEMTWNADPKNSIVASCTLDDYTGGSAEGPKVKIQSGGFVFDECWLACVGNTATALQDNSHGPLYLYEVEPEHYAGPTLVFNNCSNVWMRNVEEEMAGDWTAGEPNEITNSTNINLCCNLVGGNNATHIWDVSSSSVNLFCLYFSGGTLQNGFVKENSSYFGSTGSGTEVLDGYVDP